MKQSFLFVLLICAVSILFFSPAFAQWSVFDFSANVTSPQVFGSSDTVGVQCFKVVAFGNATTSTRFVRIQRPTNLVQLPAVMNIRMMAPAWTGKAVRVTLTALRDGVVQANSNIKIVQPDSNIFRAYAFNFPALSPMPMYNGFRLNVSFTDTTRGYLELFVEGSGILVPVGLISFTATVVNENESVLLKWETASEKNNYGFGVERATGERTWEEIGFVSGNGTANELHTYSLVDTAPLRNNRYRLRQMDTDGSAHFSQEIEIALSAIPSVFDLKQNYPNPFNPSTTIEFSLPNRVNVNLTVYNLLGQKIVTLVDGELNVGTHRVVWNAGNKPNGIYFYQLEASTFTETKRMVLMK